MEINHLQSLVAKNRQEIHQTEIIIGFWKRMYKDAKKNPSGVKGELRTISLHMTNLNRKLAKLVTLQKDLKKCLAIELHIIRWDMMTEQALDDCGFIKVGVYHG